MKGIVMYNDKTGDIKITQAKEGGDKWNKFITDGFKPIANVNGWNVQISKLDKRGITPT